MPKESKKDIFNKFVFMFIIGSVLGTYHEQILYLIKHYLVSGEITWVSRRGLLYGPFSPIYGIGAVIIYFLFCFKKRKWYVSFTYGCLLGGIYEYVMSFLQEKIWGTVSWDYSNRFLNIGGRTTVPYMIFWGLLALAFVYFIYPLICKIYNKIPSKIANVVFIVLFIFLVGDILISVVAVTRQSLRHKGVEAKTFIGRFCDKHYTDEFLKKIYANTWFVE